MEILEYLVRLLGIYFSDRTLFYGDLECHIMTSGAMMYDGVSETDLPEYIDGSSGGSFKTFADHVVVIVTGRDA